MHYDFFYFLASTVICDVVFVLHMQNIVCGFSVNISVKTSTYILIIVFLTYKYWGLFFFHFLFWHFLFCRLRRWRTTRRTRQSATNRTTRRKSRPTRRPRTAPTSPCLQWRPRSVDWWFHPRPPWTCDPKGGLWAAWAGGGGRRHVTAGGGNGDVNPSDSVNRDIDPLLFPPPLYLLSMAATACITANTPPSLKQTPPTWSAHNEDFCECVWGGAQPGKMPFP